MRQITRKIDRVWSNLLENKSIGYLVRAKIEQNISLVISNISSSFMGNRQLANHNTDDIRYNLNKIMKANPQDGEFSSENIEVMLLENRQKLNIRLLKNSEDLLEAVRKLQEVHQKIMAANDDVIKFNGKMISISIDALAGHPPLNVPKNNEEQLDEKLNKLKKGCALSAKKYERLMTDVEAVFQENLSAQEKINLKRQSILTNRRAISQSRKDIDTFL